MNKVKIVFIVLLFVFLGVTWFLLSANKSKGMRAGSIVKLSEKGVLFNTWEGQMFLGQGVVANENVTNVNSNIWEFSVVSNDTLIDKLYYYMGKGKRISLVYHQKYVKLPWRGDTDYIIVGVKEY